MDEPESLQRDREYRMPAGEGVARLTEKRSRFIARVWPTATEAEAQERIAAVRKEHWDANHNVYAYIIKDGPTRFSDDGEPHGTSGLPTLNVFRSNGIENVCCVVTRYFGGVLLGGGGLVRAYSAAAKLGLDAAGVVTVRLWRQVLLPVGYARFEAVRQLVLEHGGSVTSIDYGANILIETLIPRDRVGEFAVRLADATAGGVEMEQLDTVYRAG